MNSFALCAIVLTCLTLRAGIAQGQAIPFDPLAVPNAALLCHAFAAVPEDSAAFVFEYVDGPESGRSRKSAVAFDSGGTPLYMTVVAPGKDALGEQQTYALALRFYPKSQGARMILPEQMTAEPPRTGRVDSVKPSQVAEEQLNAIDIAHAQDLARWFWAHRCKDAR